MKPVSNIFDRPVSNLKPIFSASGTILKYSRKLPKPLKPTKYIPTAPIEQQSRPVAKLRILSKRPEPLRRSRLPKTIDEKVQKLIREITPYNKPEALKRVSKTVKAAKKDSSNRNKPSFKK